MTYCYILNVYSKYVAAEKLNVFFFCLTVAQGWFWVLFFCYESMPLVDNDTSTMMKDWQNEVLDGADGDLLSFLVFIFRFIMR